MKKFVLPLLATVLLIPGGLRAQDDASTAITPSPTPEATVVLATPTPTATSAPAGLPPLPALPTPPTPPQLQPLAPVQGPVPKPENGFPFEDKPGRVQVQLYSDEHSGGDATPEQVAGVLIPIFGILSCFGAPVLIIAMILFYRQRKTKLLHQTIQTLVEKGQPIPQELLNTGGKPIPTKSSDRRKGLMLTSIGLGLLLFFLASGNDSWGIGFIPLGIGAGYLLTSIFAPRGTEQP